MKQISLLLTCIIFLSFTDKPAETKNSAPPIPIAGVYLYSNNITTNAGNAAEGHQDEVALANDSMNIILPFTGNPPQVGAPQFGDIFIKKAFDLTSLRLMHLIADPNTKTFEVRYYNGVNTTPVYKVVLLNSYVTSARRVKADCQGSGCIGIQETYSLSFITIEYHNLMVTPAQILTYNKATNATTWTNN